MSDITRYKNWILNKQLDQETLRNILNNPTFKEAVEIAIFMRERDIVYTSGNLLEINALSHAESRGAHNLVKSLEILANPSVDLIRQTTDPKPQPKAYEHYKNETPVNTLV
jgi:hypothetical protein